MARRTLSTPERTARMAEIESELARLDRHATLTTAQAARDRELRAESLNLYREDVADVVRAGRADVEHGTEQGRPADARSSKSYAGDPWASPAGEPGARPGAIRSQAVSAIERCALLSDASRERITRDVETDDDPQGRLSRVVVELSQPAYRSAYLRWMRDPEHGHYEWSAEERDAVRRVSTVNRSLALGGSGGYLTPAELDPALIVSSAGVVDPMRRVSRQVTSAVNTKSFITTLGVTASWDAESEEVSDDTPVLLNPSVTCHKGQSFVPFSFEMGEDEPDLAQQVAVLFADSKAALEGPAFTVGTGVGEPTGVVTAVKAVPGSVVDTADNAINADDPMTLQAAVPARWRARSRFMANLSIMNVFRTLPMSATLVDPVLNSAGPSMYGWAVEENSNMDGALSAGDDFLLLAGAFDQFVIVDRLASVTEYVPHLFGPVGHRPTGERGFLLHWRTGSDVLVPDAFRVLNYSV